MYGQAFVQGISSEMCFVYALKSCTGYTTCTTMTRTMMFRITKTPATGVDDAAATEVTWLDARVSQIDAPILIS